MMPAERHWKPNQARRASHGMDRRVLAANSFAIELLAEEAEKTASPLLKLLTYVITFCLSCILWWAAVRFFLKG
jgi:hypothetical protein